MPRPNELAHLLGLADTAPRLRRYTLLVPVVHAERIMAEIGRMGFTLGRCGDISGLTYAIRFRTAIPRVLFEPELERVCRGVRWVLELR